MAKGTKFVDFGGERIEVPADSNPRTAGQASMLRQKMLKERRASGAPTESPRPAPRPQATRTPGNSQRASNPPPRRPERPSNSQSVAGDPRTRAGYDRIGASMAPTQNRTRSLPSTPSGSNVTRTAGSQADTSPRRTPPTRPQTPDRDSRPASSTTQTNTRAPVKASDITSLSQWKALTREQRLNTPGIPKTMLDAMRKYGL